MTVTFLTAIELPDDSPDSLAAIAEDIQQLLIDEGYETTSVTPWERPSQTTSPTTPISWGT